VFPAVNLQQMLDREAAQALVDAAHQICPYSKATRGNIDVTINLV
jgi:osmotically inducible protein OsmC